MLTILATFLLIFSVGILLMTAGEYAVDWIMTRRKREYEQVKTHNERKS